MSIEYSWSISSALWQIRNGEMGTERTESAFDYLRDEDNAQNIAGTYNDLLDAIAFARRSRPGN